MKKFFQKFRSYGFWVSLSSALIVLLNALGRVFGFSIQNQIVEDVILSIASFLAVFGIVSMKDISKDEDIDKNQEDGESEDDSNNKNR